MSTEPVSIEERGDDGDEPEEVVDAGVVRDLIKQNNRLQDRVDELEATTTQQGARLQALQNRNDQLVELLFDTEKWDRGAYLDAYDDGAFEPVAEHAARLEREHGDRLATLETSVAGIADLGAEKTTKELKITAIIQFAKNQAHDPTTGRIALTPKDIKGVAGVTKRYAYDLVDDLPDEYAFFIDKADVSQYGDLEIDKSTQDRALVVDLELLHSGEQALNKFNNGRGSERGR